MTAQSSALDETLTFEFSRLVEIVARLRGPDGCPWDKEQTQASLTRYILEEAFELVEAIDSQDQQHIQEELGDFLFQVILQAQVAEDATHFKLVDVLRTLSDKMIRRHPHVFAGSDQKLSSSTEVLNQWAKIKAEEAKAKSGPSPESATPLRLSKDLRGFPALLTSLKIGQRSEEWKFDWDTASQVEAKVTEELAEVQEAIALADPVAQEEEIGDLLFATAQWARHLKIDPETALRKANLKFEKRFHSMLEIAGKTQEEFRNLPLDEKEEFWGKAKKLAKTRNSP